MGHHSLEHQALRRGGSRQVEVTCLGIRENFLKEVMLGTPPLPSQPSDGNQTGDSQQPLRQAQEEPRNI